MNLKTKNFRNPLQKKTLCATMKQTKMRRVEKNDTAKAGEAGRGFGFHRFKSIFRQQGNQH